MFKMTKLTKQIISGLMIVLMMFSSVQVLSMTSLAADAVAEKESNNGSNTATVIPVDTVCSGTLGHEEDVDWYKFTADKDYFTFDFACSLDESNYANVNAGWDVFLYDAAGNEIYAYYGVKGKFSTAKYPLTGDFFIKVEHSWEGIFVSDKPIGCIYNIKINTTVDPMWEDENNDVVSDAFKISTDKKYQGTFHNHKDVDYYKFTNDKDYFIFNFDISDEANIDLVNYGWNITILANNGADVVAEYGDVTAGVKTAALPFSGDCYIKVEPSKNAIFNIDCPVDCYYNIRIDTFKDSTWEKESNSSMSKATKITSGKIFNANLYSVNDVDYFKYTATKNGVLTLDFFREVSENIGRGWKVSVLKADGTVLYSTEILNTLKLTKTNIEINKGETIYFCVEAADNWYSPSQVNYKISVSFIANPGKVTGLKVSSNNTTSLKLSWKKVDGATGYKIYRYDTSTKKYVAVATTKSTSYTVKKLKAGTSYKFKVKAYKKSYNSTAWGSSSSILTTATKPDTPTLKATAGKKAATLKWSKETGTGYVIYMATSKNGTYSKVATVKGAAKVSYVKKSLTTGKTYCFKVRAYKTVGDQTLYGSYSAIKSVKVK